MGVPKFYRWISERYPCLSQVVKDYQIPEFDNFYLDMNGIIHACSHPNDEDPTFRISDEKIFSDIFRYLESLFRIIRPQRVLFLAVDGVAPRAKMNQQRGRRFRSAREAQDLIRKALQKGKVLPSEPRFDSNCITPGTDFMSRLHEQLKYFVNQKLNTDPSWQRVEVILSGHEVPGEGEHKIMDYIRHQKAKPDYDPNTRHCLYGLDADLIMLGLITHEPHFSLLREEVRFGKKVKAKQSTPDTITFHLLHLSILREYLDFEFSCLKGKLRFPYDLEKIIDDWVLMGFLVGNDFIPHLPNMHIQQDVLPYLYSMYKELLPTLDGYINNGGVLNMQCFEAYLNKLEDFDREHYRELIGDLQWMEGKRAGGRSEGPRGGRGQPPMDESGLLLTCGLDDEDEEEEVDGEESEAEAKLLRDLGIKGSVKEYFKEEDKDRDTLLEADFSKFKAKYYQEKMGFTNVNRGVLEEQAKCYVVGIQWILHYYYSGVPSWGWFYPYHYAPFVSDIKDIATLRIEFDLGTPFLPYQQLLSVLPPASKSLLPRAYQGLMLNEDSVLKEFYPVDFATDLNGKQQDWEAVVLIPFIDAALLVEAMRPLTEQLTEEEKRRNSYGTCNVYLYSQTVPPFTYPSPWPTQFPDIANCRVLCRKLPPDPYPTSKDQLVQGLCKGILLDVFFPGFPSLKHVPHTVYVEKKRVRVFQQASQGENFCLNILTRTDLPKDIYKYAREMIGQTIYVGWPYLTEAYLWALSDRKTKYLQDSVHKSKVKVIERVLTDGEIKQWNEEAQTISRQYMERRGIDIGPVELMLYVKPLQGKRYVLDKDSEAKGTVCLQKQWSNAAEPFAFQTMVHNIAAHCPLNKALITTLEELYPPESTCFLLTPPHYGSMAQVISVDVEQQRVLVKVTPFPEPEMDRVIDDRKLSVEYRPSFSVAKEVGVHPLTLARITSSIKVERGSRENKKDRERINIGLNWKFAKRNLELPGYTHKSESNWCFSPAAIAILNNFVSRFIQMFEYLNANPKDDLYYEADLFPNPNGNESWLSVQEFLKKLPTYGLEPVDCGSLTLDAPQIAAIEKAVLDMQRQKESNQLKPVKLRVKPSLLFKQIDYQGNIIPDPAADYQLYDRVVNVSAHNAVPFGLTGTVTGIIGDQGSREQICEIVFDEEFLGGVSLRCSPNRAYHLPASCLINLSYGKRLEASRGGVDLPDSAAQRGGASHRGSPAAGLHSQGGRGHGGREERTRVGASHLSSTPPGDSGYGLHMSSESSERPSRATKGLSSSAGKVGRPKKSDGEGYSQPRTLLQRLDKRHDEPSSKSVRPSKEQQKSSTDTQKHPGNNEFSNMVREMESHSKKSQIHSTPIGASQPSTPSSSTSSSAFPSTPSSSTSSTKPATKHQVLRYSQQSISKQRENDSNSRVEAANRDVAMMDQAIGALSKLSLDDPAVLATRPNPQVPFAPYDGMDLSHPAAPNASHMMGTTTQGGEGSPSVTLKSLLQMEEQYPPQGPGMPQSYYMYGSVRQPLLPTPPQPFHHGPQPPLRGPPPMDYGYRPPLFLPYSGLPPGPPPPPPPPHFDSIRALMYTASNLGYPPPKITAMKDDKGMFFGTVEIGGMKYSGAPSSTKAEAMQIAASVASSALPPAHPAPFYPSFAYQPPHPYGPPPPPPHYRFPPIPDAPSYYTPNPYPSGPGYSYNPRGPRPASYSAPAFVPSQVDRRQPKRASPAVVAAGGSGGGTPRVKEDDVVRRNLMESLNSAAAEEESSVGEARNKQVSTAAAAVVQVAVTSQSQENSGNQWAERSNTSGSASLGYGATTTTTATAAAATTLLDQLDEAAERQEEGIRRLQELVRAQESFEGGVSSSRGREVDGLLSASTQATVKDPLLTSLFADLNDGGETGYQEAIPSTDAGEEGEVVVVGEILVQDNYAASSGILYEQGARGESQQSSSRTVEESSEPDSKLSQETITKRPKFQLAAHFDK